MNYLLDTNARIHHMRHGTISNVTLKLLSLPKETIFMNSIVLTELLFGAIRSGPANEMKNR